MAVAARRAINIQSKKVTFRALKCPQGNVLGKVTRNLTRIPLPCGQKREFSDPECKP